MKAWHITGIKNTGPEEPLEWVNIADPQPAENQVRIRVHCCGVCHTELDEIEGRTPPPRYPVIPGHQVVGVVDMLGRSTSRFQSGTRVGVAWIASSCGKCAYCKNDQENLCPEFLATGRDVPGGYAEYMVVDERFAYPIPELFSDEQVAPLLCAGAIGYRSLKLAGLVDGQVLGLTGFGASGHLVLKMAQHLYPHSPIVVFARSENEQQFARSLGAVWSGSSHERPSENPHSIIDTTPAWKPIVDALAVLRPGGRLVINAIRKEKRDQDTLQDLRYDTHLWMEKEIKSVANITRSDVEEFLELAASIPILPEIEVYAFEEANRALIDLKHKNVRGAKVLRVRY